MENKDFKIKDQSDPRYGLDEFRAEIAEMKRKEGEIGKTAHFRPIDPGELDENDMIFFGKYKKDELTIEDLENYRKQLDENKANTSQQSLAAFFANVLQIKMYSD